MTKYNYKKIVDNLDVPRTVICGVLSISCFGLLWTLILLVTLYLIARVYTRKYDDLNELSNAEDGPKRSIVKAKRRRKGRKKAVSFPNGSSIQEDNDQTCPEGEAEISFANASDDSVSGGDSFDLDSVMFSKSFRSNGLEQKRPPTLSSPLPLLSEIKCRIASRSRDKYSSPRNKYNSPTTIWNTAYGENGAFSSAGPLSPFSPAQYNSPHAQYNSPYAKYNSPHVPQWSQVNSPHKSYFSRINPQVQMDMTTVKIASPGLPTIPRSPIATKENKETTINSCSKEVVMKGLEESMRSKRKRSANPEKSPEQEQYIAEAQNKKRRISPESIDTTMDQLFPTNMKDNIRNKFLRNGISARPILKRTTVVNSPRPQLNKFSLSEEETDGLVTEKDQEVEVEKSLAKRKKSESDDTVEPRGKKQSVSQMTSNNTEQSSCEKVTSPRDAKVTSPRDANERNKSNDDKCSNLQESDVSSPNTSHTPNQLNLRSPRQLKIPYKKLFLQSFPSNLKAGSAEKRRKIPVFFGKLDDSIEISKEEYGSRGFSYEAFEADRKAATERSKLIFDDDGGEGTDAAVKTSATGVTSATGAPFGLFNTSIGDTAKGISFNAAPSLSSLAATTTTVVSAQQFGLPSKTSNLLTSGINNSNQKPMAPQTNPFGLQTPHLPKSDTTANGSTSTDQSPSRSSLAPSEINTLQVSSLAPQASSLVAPALSQPSTLGIAPSNLLPSSANTSAVSFNLTSSTLFGAAVSTSNAPSFGSFSANLPPNPPTGTHPGALPLTGTQPGSLPPTGTQPGSLPPTGTQPGFTLGPTVSSTSFTSGNFSFGIAAPSTTASLGPPPPYPGIGTTSSSFAFGSTQPSGSSNVASAPAASLSTFGFAGLATGNNQTQSLVGTATQPRSMGTFAFGSSLPASTAPQAFGNNTSQVASQNSQSMFGNQTILGVAKVNAPITFGSPVPQVKASVGNAAPFAFTAVNTSVTGIPSTQTAGAGISAGGFTFKPIGITTTATTTTSSNMFEFASKTSQSTVNNPPQPTFGNTPVASTTFPASVNPFAASSSTQNAPGQFAFGATTASTTVPQFGATSASTTVPQAPVAFGKPTFSSQTQPSVFGMASSSSSIFGSQNSSVTNTQPTGTFSFTAGTAQPSAGGFNFNPIKSTAGPTLSFGAGQTGQTGQTGQSPFGGASLFGKTTASSTPAFGKPTASAAVFGQTPTVAAPVFGQTPTAAPASVFGQVPTAMPAFGQPATTSANQNAFGTSMFGQAPGTFGTAGQAAKPQSTGFNFSASAKTPAAFNFGGAVPGITGFGNTATPTPAFGNTAFGTAPQAPVPAAGFNIGSSGTTSAQRPTHRARRRLRKYQ